MNTLKSGLGKVWHGRIITITTDGHIRGAVLDQEKEQNRAILKEYNPMNGHWYSGAGLRMKRMEPD